jgi:uncharacterized membrane protein
LVWLPVRLVGAFGLLVILLHNCLDPIPPESFGAVSWLWKILHAPGLLYRQNGWNLSVPYVLIPWAGVMAAGYAFGFVYTWTPEKRKRLLLLLGVSISAAFILVRGLNAYGDPRPWSHQPRALFSVFSFVDCTKYPPSLDYLLMTIGPALVILRFLERCAPGRANPALIFGRVPLFYYLLHIPLLHAMAVIVALLRHGNATWLFTDPFSGAGRPPNAGFGLVGVYALWLVALAILYPLCRWFAALKARRRDVWLSYL